jgi:import receptor subunit TOM20
LIETVITAAAHETYPKTPEDMEKYFMAQVAEGEGLCAKGK